jgi:hypothetical protein
MTADHVILRLPAVAQLFFPPSLKIPEWSEERRPPSTPHGPCRMRHDANNPDRELDEPLIGTHGQWIAGTMQHVTHLSPTAFVATGQPPIANRGEGRSSSRERELGGKQESRPRGPTRRKRPPSPLGLLWYRSNRPGHTRDRHRLRGSLKCTQPRRCLLSFMAFCRLMLTSIAT